MAGLVRVDARDYVGVDTGNDMGVNSGDDVWVNARNDMRIYARNYEVHRGQVGSEHDHTESCCKESSESDQS